MRLVAQDLLDRCVHCGLCLASCPTYVELGSEADSPRGRIHLIQALEDGVLAPTHEVRRHLDLCLGCRACETACPSGVEYGRLIEAARPYVEGGRPWPARLARRSLATMLASRRWRAAAALPLRLVVGRSGLGALARRLPARLGGWLALAAAVPPVPRAAPLPEVLEPAGPARGTAVLLTGCVASTLFPATNRNTAALLVRAGVRVLVPREQGCCGALALHLGAGERARRLARAATAELGSLTADWLVTNAAGCGAHLRGLDHVLPGDSAAAALAARTRDALELLAELGLPPAARPLPRTIAIHDPCHLAHAQGVRGQVRRLLADVPGVQLTELAESDWCCGSAGTYNLTEPAMARRLLARKLDHVAASGAQVVAAANPGCLLQIRAGAIARGLAVEIAHPIDLLAAAHGVA